MGGTPGFGIVKIIPRILTCYQLVLATTATVVWIALISCNALILTVCCKDAKLYFILQCNIKLKLKTRGCSSLHKSQCLKHSHLQYLDSDVGRQMAGYVCNCRQERRQVIWGKGLKNKWLDKFFWLKHWFHSKGHSLNSMRLTFHTSINIKLFYSSDACNRLNWVHAESSHNKQTVLTSERTSDISTIEIGDSLLETEVHASSP